MRIITVFIVWLFVFLPACATKTASLSDEDAADSVKQALTQSVNAAVDKLGATNGFLNNPQVKIPLPGSLRKAESAMRTLGMSKYADSLIMTMNRAAEAAATEARPLLLEAVRKMPLDDAKALLTGGNDAATQYFRNNTSDALTQKVSPIVKNATDQTGLVRKYNEFAGKGAKFGLVAEKDANIENYVTQKILDGIYLTMAEEERVIRNDPMGQSSQLLQRVFGSLK